MNQMTRQRRRHSRWKRPQRVRSAERATLVVAGSYFVLLALFGGGVVNWTPAYMLLVVATLAAAGFAAWRDGFAALGRLPMTGRIAVVAVAVLPLLQFMPLPPAIWQALPGQELRIATLGLIGAADTWQPLTLDPIGTGLSAILAIGFVVLIALLMRLDEPGFQRMLDIALAVALAGILIGILQVVSDGQFPRLHAVDTGPVMLGFQANKNHMGLVIACALALFGTITVQRFDPRSRQWVVIGATLFALICIVTTNSRAGLMVGVLAGLVVLAGTLRQIRWQYWVAAGVAALAIIAFVMSSSAFEVVSSRFGDVDDDLRWQITNWSIPLAERYWLTGSGAGSYVAVFNQAEQLDWVKRTYVNAAHNDYLQTVIELGLAGVAVIALLAASLVIGLLANRSSANGLPRQALFGLIVATLFALHSVVDYPLRRPATWVFFALALAAIYRARGAAHKAP